jgi:XRE family transcriptional regulator, regulator of sulfur utilization
MRTDEARAGTLPPDPPTNAALGRAIRRLRQQRGLSIEALALNAGLHPTYLSEIERGVRNPTWSKLGALASTLGMSVSAVAAEAEREIICPTCGHPQADGLACHE